VAAFEHQTTSLSASEGDSSFVNFPRWPDATAVSVAGAGTDSALRPIPNAKWKAWRNAGKDELPPEKHSVCVQNIGADSAPARVLIEPRTSTHIWFRAEPSRY
jgi:hypothetical protein